MKKIIILTIMLFTALSSTVFADSIENINISRTNNGEVIVSGNLNVSKTNQQLVLTVTNQGSLITSEQTTVKEIKDGKAYYEFDPILFPYDALSGCYTYTVSGRYIDAPKSKNDDKMTVSSDDFYVNISVLNSKIQSGSQDDVYNYLSSNSALLDIDGSSLSSINKALPIFKKLLMEKQFTCTQGDYVSIEKARVEFVNRYNDLISICKFYQIDSLDSFNDWLNNFSREFPNQTNDGDKYSYYTRIKDKQILANKITYLNNVARSRTQFGTFAEEKQNVYKIFYEAVFLTNIFEENAAVTQNIITGFTDYFVTNNTYYNQLSSQKQGEVFGFIKGNSYVDSASVSAAFLTYSKQLYENQGNNQNNVSNTGTTNGSSWGKESSIPFVTAPQTQTETVFSDIENVSWAKDAILKLYERKIVSGKAEKKFAPNDNVTRAEFLKMVVLANGIEVVPATEKTFNDVDLDKWYADIVNTAKINGIISGDENNNFNPDNQISRQDMSIIVARALGYTSGGSKYAPFGDLETIDDYALDYVVYLYERKLLTGDNNGLFNPKNNTRRSEAAVLIYRMIMNNEL